MLDKFAIFLFTDLYFYIHCTAPVLRGIDTNTDTDTEKLLLIKPLNLDTYDSSSKMFNKRCH